MQYIGKTVNITSDRTGKVVKLNFSLTTCFPSAFDYQQFLINLYMNDFSVYQKYTKLISMYISVNPNKLPSNVILENKTILSTINAMYFVRDSSDKEDERLEHLEMQEFIYSLSNKNK